MLVFLFFVLILIPVIAVFYFGTRDLPRRGKKPKNPLDGEPRVLTGTRQHFGPRVRPRPRYFDRASSPYTDERKIDRDYHA